jgi:serine/threonine protein phosphatase PrpC
VECGGVVADDGYCEQCGAKAPLPRDHLVDNPAAWVGGVSDKGRVHGRNEDALALGATVQPGRFAALVVCDGVSTVPRSDEASLAAAHAALDVLAAGGPGGSGPVAGDEATRTAAWAGLLDRAARAGDAAVVDLEPPDETPAQKPADTAGPSGSTPAYGWSPEAPAVSSSGAAPSSSGAAPSSSGAAPLSSGAAPLSSGAAAASSSGTPDAAGDPPAADPGGTTEDLGEVGEVPSCTFVAAVVDGDLLHTGCVGDSRAYWLPDEGEPTALTRDDSWAAEAIAGGKPRAQAEEAPQAHAITRWLGADSPDVAARATTRRIEGPGWVLVCSDGLWNYCSEAADLAALLRERTAAVGADPLVLSDALVRWANAQGGRDNITVVLARLDAAANG